MRFTTQTLVALLATPLLALAQNSANPFKNPLGGYTPTAGKTIDITWDPTTSGTVTLILRSGPSNNLNQGIYIAQSIKNDGTYTWSVPSDITRGSDYAFEIVDDSDPTNVNYTPPFVLESTNTVASSTPALSGSPSSSVASKTGSSSSTMTGSSSSMTGSSSSMTGSSTSMTRSSSSSMTGSMTSSTRSATRSTSASSSAAALTGGAVATAVPFGLLALGALVL